MAFLFAYTPDRNEVLLSVGSYNFAAFNRKNKITDFANKFELLQIEISNSQNKINLKQLVRL